MVSDAWAARSGLTAILITVPELAAYTERWRSVSRSTARSHVPLTELIPPHVTVLVPWVAEPTEADVRRLADAVAYVRAVRAELPDRGSVPERHGVAEARTVRRRRLVAVLGLPGLPECPPYGGEFPDPQPHLTISSSEQGGPAVVAEARAALAAAPAPRLQLTELGLWREGDDGGVAAVRRRTRWVRGDHLPGGLARPRSTAPTGSTGGSARPPTSVRRCTRRRCSARPSPGWPVRSVPIRSWTSAPAPANWARCCAPRACRCWRSSWTTNCPPSLTGLVIANEWLDNIPCELVEWDEDGVPRYLSADLTPGDVVDGNDLDWLRALVARRARRPRRDRPDPRRGLGVRGRPAGGRCGRGRHRLRTSARRPAAVRDCDRLPGRARV